MMETSQKVLGPEHPSIDAGQHGHPGIDIQRSRTMELGVRTGSAGDERTLNLLTYGLHAFHSTLTKILYLLLLSLVH